jgi:DNA primase
VWSLTHGLFPFDTAVKLMQDKGLTTMVLVEGPRDALRLIQMGIPACSILGTHSWSDNKRRLLEFAGVTRLITMFDGDEAGYKAHLLVRENVQKTFDYSAVKLWKYPIPEGHPEDKLDPGNCPKPMLVRLKKQLT